MNREIKFRAWNGKYMLDSSYGDWVSFDGIPYTEADKKYDTPHTEIEKAKGYILMQYTGLTDINGKEIYEGDILRVMHEGIREKIIVCEFKNGAYTIEWDGMFWEGADITNISWAMDQDFEFEIIGNIYEHSHLLKPKTS